MNQQIEFLSDGGDDVREVQLYLSPEADHLLDWFHVTMRITTLTQTAKEQNPQNARRNNFPGEQISRRFLLLSENLSASNYPGAAKGLPETSGEGNIALQADVLRDLERIKWFLWHGNTFKTLQVLGSVESNLAVEALTSGNGVNW